MQLLRAVTGMKGKLGASVGVALLALSGCAADSDSGEWAGSVHDSAGIIVVTNPESGLLPAATGWRLEEDLRIGVVDGDPVRQFGRIAGIAVDGGGRIYVLDRQAREIRVFEADGGFVRTIGRPGSGPGELASPSAVLLGTEDTIFVPDTRNQRVQRFLPDGSEAGSFPIAVPGGIPMEWRIRPDGLLLVEVRTLPATRAPDGDERILVLLLTPDGVVRDTVLEMRVGEAMRIQDGQPHMTVFAPEPMWAQLVDGRVATGRNSEYRLEIRTPGGRLERVVQKPFERRPFSESDHRALGQLLREHFDGQPPSQGTARMLESLSYGDHHPVFASLFGGPGETLWVQRARHVASLEPADMEDFNVRAMGSPEYDVFDRVGRFVGTLAAPSRFRPMLSAGEHVYGAQRDELGVHHVVRLRGGASGAF